MCLAEPFSFLQFCSESHSEFQPPHTITFSRAMISVACQKVITSAQNNAETRGVQPQHFRGEEAKYAVEFLFLKSLKKIVQHGSF